MATGRVTSDDAGGVPGPSASFGCVCIHLEAIGCGSQVTEVMRFLSIGARVVGLVFVVLMALGDAGVVAAFGAIGHGDTERMIVYPTTT